MAERYTLAQASDINSVFSRLEQLRRAHYEGAGQTAEGKNALASAFQTAPVVQTSTIEEPYTLMKSYLNALRKSVFLTTVTEEQINEVTVPEAGALIEFANLNVAENLVTTLESKPSSYTTNFSGHNTTNFSGHNGSDFGTDFSCFMHNGSEFSPEPTFSSSFRVCTKCFKPFQDCFSSHRTSAFGNSSSFDISDGVVHSRISFGVGF